MSLSTNECLWLVHPLAAKTTSSALQSTCCSDIPTERMKTFAKTPRLLCQCHGAFSPSCGLVGLMDAGLHTLEENMDKVTARPVCFLRKQSRSKTVCCIKSEALTLPGRRPLVGFYRVLQSRISLIYGVKKATEGLTFLLALLKCSISSCRDLCYIFCRVVFLHHPKSFQQFSREICDFIDGNGAFDFVTRRFNLQERVRGWWLSSKAYNNSHDSTLNLLNRLDRSESFEHKLSLKPEFKSGINRVLFHILR